MIDLGLRLALANPNPVINSRRSQSVSSWSSKGRCRGLFLCLLGLYSVRTTVTLQPGLVRRWRFLNSPRLYLRQTDLIAEETSSSKRHGGVNSRSAAGTCCKRSNLPRDRGCWDRLWRIPSKHNRPNLPLRGHFLESSPLWFWHSGPETPPQMAGNHSNHGCQSQQSATPRNYTAHRRPKILTLALTLNSNPSILVRVGRAYI